MTQGSSELIAALDQPFGQQSWEELEWLCAHIRGAKAILEIGSCFGQTLRVLANAAAPGARICSIDLGMLPPAALSLAGLDVKPKLNSVAAELRKQGFDVRLKFGNSRDGEAIAWARQNGPYDLVLIDGDHSHEGVSADWVNYRAMGRVVAFHDVANPGEAGVRALWAEIRRDGYVTKQCVCGPHPFAGVTGIGMVMMDGAAKLAPSNKALSIIVATRGRPDRLRETLLTTLGNIACASTKVVVAIDDDDAETIAALAGMPAGVALDVAPREDSLGEKYNRVLRLAPADVYLAMVDYAPHLTPGFDRLILEAASSFPDGYAVVYNKLANLNFPEINAVTHKLAVAMGGFYPPYFAYWFIDFWLHDIARMIDRVVFVDVKVDRTNQPITMERREPEFWARLYKLLQPVRRKIAQDIIQSEDFAESEARKQVLLGNIALVEQHSAMTADAVANIAGDPSVDARYLRIKDKALQTATQLGSSRDLEALVRNDPPAQKPVLFILFSSGRACNTRSTSTLVRLATVATLRGIMGGFAAIASSEPAGSRDAMLGHWYEDTQSSHILCVADGLEFDPNLVLEMLDCDKPLVGAVYPGWSGQFLAGDCRIVNGFMRVAALGAGLMLIRRDCIDAIAPGGALCQRWRRAAPAEWRGTDGQGEIWANVSWPITANGCTRRYLDEIKQICLPAKAA